MLKNTIAFILLLCTLVSCVNYEAIEIKDVKEVSIKQANTNEVVVSAKVQIANPNAFAIDVQESAFDIFVKDKLVGSGSMDKSFKLKKNSEDYHAVQFESSFEDLNKDVLMSLMSAALFNSGGVPFKLKGYVKGKAFFITKKVELEYEDKVPIEF